VNILKVLELFSCVSCSDLDGSRVTSIAPRPKFKVRAVHVVRGFDFCELGFTRFFFNLSRLSVKDIKL
jgi:hypothetical protein